MKSKPQILQAQRDWAVSTGLTVDEHGYVGSVEDNLYRPLSQATRLALECGSGSELRPAKGRPPKMAALHSSAALAVNTFDPWSGRPLGPLAAALRLGETPDRMAFEATFPTGLKGTPPHIDLAFFGPGDRVVGVESKFTEWLTPKSPNKLFFRPDYFPERGSLWSAVGLAQAQRLADAVRSGEEGFRYLDAAQLLKHMLGLANVHGANASLLYLYYDRPGEESRVHQNEIARFTRAIDGGMPFRSLSYQEFFLALKGELGGRNADHLAYLERRYFRLGGR